MTRHWLRLSERTLAWSDAKVWARSELVPARIARADDELRAASHTSIVVPSADAEKLLVNNLPSVFSITVNCTPSPASP